MSGGDNMLALVNQAPPGTFDVILADAEYLAMLREGGHLDKLDPADYPLKDYWPEFQKFPLHWHDGELYAVLTGFGYLGLSYNTKAFKPEEVSSYEVLWSDKAKGKAGFFDWYLPSMGVISLYNGNKPPFDIGEEKFAALKTRLASLKPQVSGFYSMADTFSSLTNGQVLLILGIGEWVTLGTPHERRARRYDHSQGGWNSVDRIAVHRESHDQARPCPQVHPVHHDAGGHGEDGDQA